MQNLQNIELYIYQKSKLDMHKLIHFTKTILYHTLFAYYVIPILKQNLSKKKEIHTRDTRDYLSSRNLIKRNPGLIRNGVSQSGLAATGRSV